MTNAPASCQICAQPGGRKFMNLALAALFALQLIDRINEAVKVRKLTID